MGIKWVERVLAYAIIAAALGFLGWAYYTFALPHWSDIPNVRRKVDRIKRVSRSDIDAMQILLDRKQLLTLKSPEDKGYIDQLVGSLKRMTVADTEFNSTDEDLIIVHVKGKPYGIDIRVEGHFDPDRAPVVSKALRSDDLGKLVYDVFRRKGIVPRKS